jgi:chemotaxis receptor (MCP) glutamine deamidase CheD
MPETSVALLQCGVADSGLLKIDRIGSGIGVIIYDNVRHIGAGLHVLASQSLSLNHPNPLMYVNTAIPHGLAELTRKGGNAPFSVAIAGGATLRVKQPDQILGMQIVEATKEALKKTGLHVTLEQTGGNNLRCMVLDINAGKIKII